VQHPGSAANGAISGTGAPTAVTTNDMAFRLTGWGEGAADLYGWHADEVLGEPLHEVFRPRWEVGPAATKLARLGQFDGEVVATHRDGSARFVRITVRREPDAAGAAHLVVRHWDLTAHRRSEIVGGARQAGLAALARGDAHGALAIAADALTDALPGAGVAVLRCDQRGCPHLEVSAGLEEGPLERALEGAVRAAADGAPVACEDVLAGLAPEAASCVPVEDADGARIGSVAVVPDGGRDLTATELEVVESILPLLAVGLATKGPPAAVDALTGLAGWTSFDARLRSTLGAGTAPDDGLAVVAVHLDRLHAINDELGLAAGDGVLRTVAGRLTRAAPPDALVCRMGGDRFGLVVEPADGPGLEQLADGILEAVRQPIHLEGGPVVVTASVGAVLAVAPMTPEAALGQAVAAAKAARDAGGGRVVTASGCPAGTRVASLAADLDAALHAGELDVHYQPLIDLQSTRTIAVEALLRWTHPARGPVSPGDFIPAAEETGLIVPLGAWVLERACGDAAGWGEDGPAVAVNVSARQLLGARIVGQVRNALAGSGLPPHRLCLELTETALAQPDAPVILTELRRMGVQIALDDFGTGFSSLDHVARFPIDELKIDARFVLAAPGNPAAEAVVRAVAALGSSLGLRTVAEGVEGQEHLDLLRHSGCQVGQGYLFARPMPLGDLLDWFTTSGDAGPGVVGTDRGAAHVPVPAEPVTSAVEAGAVLDGAADVTVVLAADGTVAYVSGASLRLLGWDPAEQIGRSALELVHPSQVDDVICALSDTARDLGSARPFDVSIHTADGAWRTMEACATNHVHDRRINGVVVTLRDVSGQRGLVSALGSDPAARTLDLMGVGVWTVDRSGRTLAANTAMARLATTTIDDLRRTGVAGVLDLDPGSLARGDLGTRHDGWRAVQDTTLRRRDGTEASVRVIVTELFGPGGELAGHVLGVVEVGDLVAHTTAARAAERSWRAALEQVATGIGLLGAEGQVRTANRALVELLGRPSDGLAGAGVVEHVHPDDRAAVVAALASLRGGTEAARIRCRTRGPRHAQRSVELGFVSLGPAPGRSGPVLVEARDLTSEVALSESLETQRALADTLVDVAGSLVVVLDAAGRVERWNQACERAVGWSLADLGDRPFWEVLIPQEGSAGARRAFEALGTGEHRFGENEILTRGGQRRRVAWHYAPLHGGDGRWTHLVATGIDVTDQRDAEQDRDRFFALSRDLFAVLDGEGTVLRANPALSSVAGVSAGGVHGRSLLELVHPEDVAPLRRALHRPDEAEPVDTRVGGDGRWTWMSWRLVGDAATGVTYAAAHDITSARAERERLEAAALTDPLTGLLNRAGLQTHAAARIRDGRGTLGLLLCDLDGFKSINDTWGHATGDEVLRVVAARLGALAVGVDGLACRFGGDEFVVLVPADADGGPAGTVAADLARAVARPVRVGGDLTVTLAAAIGTATVAGEVGLAGAIAAADAELYAQKRARAVPCPLVPERAAGSCPVHPDGDLCQDVVEPNEASQSCA
jgi:diguanylate cyclase (GGDEF)-like protein/PAS domain S-box-containing protein